MNYIYHNEKPRVKIVWMPKVVQNPTIKLNVRLTLQNAAIREKSSLTLLLPKTQNNNKWSLYRKMILTIMT